MVGDVLQEQHHQDVILVLSGIDDAPEGVASGPRRLVDLLLGKLVAHWGVFPFLVLVRILLARSTRIRLIIFLRVSAASWDSSRSLSASASTATILLCVSMSGTSSSRSSRLDRGIIRMFVPRAATSK